MESQEYQVPTIQTDEEKIRLLDELSQNETFKDMSLGHNAASRNTNEATERVMSEYIQQLPSMTNWQLGYTVVFMKDYSEIQLKCEDPSNNFTWKFMNLTHFHKSEENEERGIKRFTYGVSTADNTIFAMKHLRRTMNIFPAPINMLMVYNDALFREDIVLEISKIGEVRQLYIDGFRGDRKTRWKSEAFDVLLKNITVQEQFHGMYISGKEPIMSSKIAQIPFVWMDLPTAPAPETLFAAASQKKSFNISTGPRNFYNSLIHCWLNSERCDMDVLKVYIKTFTGESNNRPFYGLFDSLMFVEGSRVCPHSEEFGFVGKTDAYIEDELKNLREKPIEYDSFEHLLEREGFEISRKDGATLCVCYRSTSRGALLILTADYPGQSVRAEKMDEYCDHYAQIVQISANFLEQTYRWEGINKRVADWVEQNRAMLNAAEKVRHRRYQAAAEFTDTLERSKYWCEDALGSVLREEIRQFYRAAERKSFGYFELGKQKRCCIL